MSAFDKVIGYDSIKNELKQVCDMIHNGEVYESLGVRLPRGILLYGDPGLGKTLMAKCFIEESGLNAYIVRRNKGGDGFVDEITDAFKRAAENAPSIVFLDDIDKFANEDDNHCDAEEYVAVQAGIDDIKDSGVFVIATANNINKLPRSLKRSGRFDIKVEFNDPSGSDAENIIAHYLNGKKIAEDVNMEDLAKMLVPSSCAQLETVLNSAAISAAYARKECINMSDLVQATLKMQYEAPDYSIKKTVEELRKIALHEAGHLVMSEVLDPGSVGLASLRSTGRDSVGGFIKRCREPKNRRHAILIFLASKVAVELYYAETCASGCQSDISSAYSYIREGMSTNATCGLFLVDVETRMSPSMSGTLNSMSEAVVHAEMERYMFKARDILLKNKEFLEKATEALFKKETLLYSEIQEIRNSVKITEAVA